MPSGLPPLRRDQFPGVPRWLSGHAGTFYPLTVLPRRNLTPRQTHLLPGNARELLPAGAGGSVPWRPPAVMRECRALFPPHSPACRTKVFPNACRKAHRNYSLFPIHSSLPTRSARRHTAPRQTRPLPGNARELLPAGALSPPGHGPCPGCVRVSLACPQILSANCSPQGLPYFMGI